MSGALEVDVAVVGAGPVGTTVAMELRSRGVETVLIDKRPRDERPNARCNTVAARTMEIWRRLGVADAVRAVGLPDDYPGDVVWITRWNGREVARLPLPSRSTRFRDMAAADGRWPTAEPVHRASQYFFDPVLRAHARDGMGVPMLEGFEVTDFVQHDDHVELQARSPGDGSTTAIRCRYLVGADGGQSTIRRRLGIAFGGDDAFLWTRSALVRCPWVGEHRKGRRGWMNWCLGPRTRGNVIAIDGRELWLVHLRLPLGVTDYAAMPLDEGIRDVLGLPPEVAYEVVHQEDWAARRLVAERFRDRRVYICGDAAHIWVPFAGYGMNCGVADAANLAWTLAARLGGWGGERLLDCYEAERYPVTEQVSHYAMNKAIEYVNLNLKRIPPEIGDDGEHGDAIRDDIGRALLDTNIPQYNCIGLNFGYFYDQSPIIAYDDEAAPAYSMDSYVPSTVPGCRLPHFWRPDGTSLYDLLGPWYTLVRFDPTVEVEPLVAAARQRGVPLAVLDIGNPDPLLFRHPLTLSRPDQHVAWRGDRLPEDVTALVDLIRGAGA